jgi:predicted nucleic acid-binding protein
MMESLYIETSVISHATAKVSGRIEFAALQQQARLWWDTQRTEFRLVSSQLVLEEASRGDPAAAAERLKLLEGISLVSINHEVQLLAGQLLTSALLPPKATADAIHVATAAVAGVDYLLTQNCRHIANALMLPRVYELLRNAGYGQLLICTPAQFLGDQDEEPGS